MGSHQISGRNNVPYKKTRYGNMLSNNKFKIQQAFKNLKIDYDLRVLFMSMAMIETCHMSSDERDKSKDNTPSQNISLWNLNLDLVKSLGYNGNLSHLNTDAGIITIIKLLNRAVNIWNVNALLNYTRGGQCGFKDGISYGCKDYRDTVATIFKVLSENEKLMFDDSRIEINLYHV